MGPLHRTACLVSNGAPLNMLQKAVEQLSSEHSSRPPHENLVQTAVKGQRMEH